METPRLPIRSSIRYGWETFKKRPWFLIGALLLVFIIEVIIPGPKDDQPYTTMAALFVISMILSTFIQLGVTNFSLRAHDAIEATRLKDLWHPHGFWRYLGATILTMLCVIVGLILLIIPGIIVAIALSFVSYAVVDKGLGPVAALKESWRITKGNRWRLLLFWGALVLINIAGALLLFVGLLVTVPVSMLATVHAYRFLDGARPETVPASSEPENEKSAAPEDVASESASAE